MNIKIKATNFEITPAIEDYIGKRISSLDKFARDKDGSARCDIEVGKTTKHHRSGDVFRAEINLHVSGKNFYAVSEKDDLYAAIDEVRDEIAYALTSYKDRTITVMRRGALKVKNMLKGLDWRNKNR